MHVTQLIALQIVKDVHLRQALLRAQKFESLAVGGLVQFFHLLAHASPEMDAATKAAINTSLKNLLFFTHQNLLIVVQILLNRMVAGKSNYWATNLAAIVNAKMAKKVKTKGEAVQVLKVHMQNSENIIRNIIKTQQAHGGKKRIFALMNDWLNAITTVTNEKIRETLYNIEQFRADALNLTSEKPPATGPAAKGISSTTKTSGTSNLVGAGNSLTGKNPFAILKASAIASTSTAKFPNNFTNLPKVTPPFLPALEGEARQSTYTLVLDLDETLIHNVEYGSDSYFLVRPGCVYFIELMAKFYEIVIFTAALQDYADQVIDQIDVNKNIKYRLYRQHTSQNGPFLVKDLSLLGRDITKTIIIDNISDNFILQPENGIFISTWYDDMADTFLEEISPLLIEVAEKKVPDVRRALRAYRDQILRQISNGAKEPSIRFH